MLKLLKVLLALVFPLIITLLAAFWYLNTYLNRELPLPESPAVFILEPGTGYSAMVNQLEQQGWLTNPAILKIYARINPAISEIKAGEYHFEQGMSLFDVLALMMEGDVVRHQLTLLEGWTMKQVISSLSSQPLLEEEILHNDERLWKLLSIDEPFASIPEGLFFPDTYDYHLGDKPSSVLLRAYKRLVRVLQDEWDARDAGLPYQNAYEALIMASIIEKETGVPEEREQIAGVFVRRLNLGMRLQTDPTVIYGLGAEYKGNLRGSHLRDENNIYNTYRQHGLPPSPIALAGREAIHAALHPAEGDTIFFVAKGDGTHYFSATLKEHETAVKQYQLNRRRADYRSAPPVQEKKP
ncbi:Endolytic murein transglycosylase [Zhongshania aliphaticivorans]|uniref:Endolytic murein transglycosylase n=2 Tax=Zhongshania aliphaticivorans TaxID=1470434 RepID=A0A5S9NYW0_9GAMM|nr:Endolytic murein transglycosylase [Zhongshania aliphaticivorans]CAA0096089.1 Endolytic murein transglycosylase [Zhongshania aliphaticivorans]